MNSLSIVFIFLSLLHGCGSETFLGKSKQKEPKQKSAHTTPAPTACLEGDMKKSDDGCNTCTCDDGFWACTDMACSTNYDGDCIEELPKALTKAIEKAYKANQTARNIAVNAEQKRLNVTPLAPSMTIGFEDYMGQKFKPEIDPFLESVVALGEDHDIRTEGYEVNHGKMGLTRIYETAPESKKYFIVDRIGGDGIGGNGKTVVAETSEYAPMSLLESEIGNSWHSWQVRDDNFIVRANQSPSDNLIEEVRICGCGPGGYEVENPMSSGIADEAPPRYEIGIFMLPGTKLPQIGGEDQFDATFERDYYKKIYVPSEGNQCLSHEAVC